MTWLTNADAKEQGVRSIRLALPDGTVAYPKFCRAADPTDLLLEILVVVGGDLGPVADRLQPREPRIAHVLTASGLELSQEPMPADARRLFWDGAHWLTARGGLATGAPATLIVSEGEA